MSKRNNFWGDSVISLFSKFLFIKVVGFAAIFMAAIFMDYFLY